MTECVIGSVTESVSESVTESVMGKVTESVTKKRASAPRKGQNYLFFVFHKKDVFWPKKDVLSEKNPTRFL